MRTLSLFLLVQAAALGATHRVQSADVVELVFTSLYSDCDDRRLAQELNRVKMTEQLSPSILPYFRSLGVGPEALTALWKLHEQSTLLPLPVDPPLSIQPVPTPAEQQTMREHLLQYARSYIQNLPDFLCDQITRRYTNLKGIRASGMPLYDTKLGHSDQFTRSLRFSSGRELGSVIQSSRKAAGDVTTKIGQSITSGEFGGDLLIIFGPRIDFRLRWDHWERGRGKRRAVFHYFVSASQSQYTLLFCCLPSMNVGENLQQRYNPAIQGLVGVDPATGAIARLTIQAIALPPTFPIRESNTVIDYEPVSLGGHAYMLPAKALAFTRVDNGQKNRNELTFTRYRKFEAESVLLYDDGSAPDKVGTRK